MKKLRKSLIVLALGATAICGISLSISKNNLSEVNAEQHVENFELYDYQNYSGTYYDFLGTGTLTNGLNGTLRTKLSSNILPKDWYSYSGSGEKTLSSILQQADEDPSNHDNMVFLYTRDSVKKQPAGTWNREHTWPKSLSGGNWGEGKAGTDILHLRPTYQTPNSTRSSNKFAEISGGQKRTYNGMDFGYTSGSNFMPLDAVKGDVARIIMYVWVAYKDYYSSMPNITNVFESYDTLLKWHTQDKPDLMEAHRNDVAEDSYQKNRNPFVDHPEYAWKIFGDSASASVKNACIAAYPDSPSPTVKTLSDIKVSGTPNKTTYVAGESFDITGLTVIATYSDNTTEDVTNKVTISPDPLTAGTTSVTVTYTYLGKTASKTITGLSVSSAEIPVTSVKINNSVTNFTVGGTCNLDVTVLPSNATNRSLTYKSNNTTVATVDGNGKVTFKAAGSATITATSNNGKSDTITFNVSSSKIDVESVTASLSKDKYIVGDKEQIDYEVLPENATNKNVSFNSSNKNVATVDSNGNVSFIGAGEVTLYVTSNENQDIFDSITLTVEEKPAPVSKLVEIAVSSKPDKTVYSVGEPFDPTGLSVVANYLDGSSVDITGEVEFDEPDTSTEGTKTINITFNETFKTDFDIIVLKDEVSSLKIAKYPLKTHYFESEEFNPLGIVVTAKIGGNTQDVTNLVEYEYDFSLVAQVTVKFEDLYKDIFVTIESGEITDEHKAADFAYIVEDKVQDISVDNVTLTDWEVLEHYYNALDEDAQKVLQETVTQYVNGVSAGEELSDTLMECVSKYDEIYLAHKDEGFTDFMSRNPKAPTPTPTPTPKPNGVDLMKILKVAGIVLGIIVLIVLIIVISVVASKKSKKKHA